MEEIKGILQFMVEIEQLKDVHRQTKPVGLDRYENSAEHSWHVCLSALMLKDYANEEIDITRVMKMLLIHDLGKSMQETLSFMPVKPKKTSSKRETASSAC